MKKRTPRAKESFPEVMLKAEAELIPASRQGRTATTTTSFLPALPADCVGVALSGGGIRSATFCLGFFQGLAKLRLLHKIDYLSTVSGGGFFGSFYTRLFTRREVPGFAFVQQVLDPQHVADNPNEGLPPRKVFNWLRENGRYLSPNGAGDLLLGGSVLLRNLQAIHLVLMIFFLALFLAGQGLRELLRSLPIAGWEDLWHKFDLETVIHLPGDISIWSSPFMVTALLLLVFWAAPYGGAYWVIGHCSRKSAEKYLCLKQIWGWPFATMLVVVLVSATIIVWPAGEPIRLFASAVLAVTAVTLAQFFRGLCKAVTRFGEELQTVEEEEKERITERYQGLFIDDEARHWLSKQLTLALVVLTAVLLFALIDSLGQTLYVLMKDNVSILKWGGGVWTALLALTPFVTRIAKALGWAESNTRPKGLNNILLAATALALAGFVLISINVASHAIAWGFHRPATQLRIVPATIETAKPGTELTLLSIPDSACRVAVYAQPREAEMKRSRDCTDERASTFLYSALALTVLLSILFGQTWPFIHRSSHLPLYSARLTRAYLGASNPLRHKNKEGNVTQVKLGDDLATHHYWPWPTPPEEAKPTPASVADKSTPSPAGSLGKCPHYNKGAPLHLINVTINETIDGKSQVEQQDRKGVGMALGPAGISASVRHHVVFHHEADTEKTSIFPKQNKRDDFRMFEYPNQTFTGQRLSLGQWVSISGAAFSTGLGSRTSLGLSLLTGMANIRLGYWWDSAVKERNYKDSAVKERSNKDSADRKVKNLVRRLFPVQTYLLDEFTSRFPGCARQHWNLSDGGHFENMGGYELIRRRLPVMVIIDAEADPDYTFSGLANLIRKARIDFSAEITFLDEGGLDELFGKTTHHYFGTLAELRRGKPGEECRPKNRWPWGKTSGIGIETSDQRRFSLAHGAIARVHYHDEDDTSPDSWLIYVKPSLVGEESSDLLQYHCDHPSFPQESTADQFFDEAQWESYRKLGEHIATVLLVPDDKKPWEKRAQELTGLCVPAAT